jgi:anti-sigma factor RsiW
MSCSQFDLNAYCFGELTEPDRRLVANHLKACQQCREELERLHVTRAALGTLRDQEPPRRIAFVSDKVFEPRGWQRLWNSGPRLAFVSAAMLSMAIIVHGLVRPAPVIAPTATDTAALETRLETELARRVQALMEKVTAESELRQARKTAELVAAAEKKFEQQRRADLLTVEENLQVLQKRYNVYRIASNRFGETR